MGLNNQWMQRDLAVLWHPCTQMKDHQQLPLVPIKRGEGVWLEDFEGKRYLDAVSSWWVNVFGHANPRINQRIKDQVDQLEHVILAGFSHQPVIELSERLVAMTPEGLTRCFYADNGSSCIEVALKMSFHYWLNRGQPNKKRFVTLTNSYHGETIAAMSVGDVPLFTETYKALLLDTIKVPSPDCYLRPEGMSWEEHSRNMFLAMEQTLADNHDTVAAVIVEPLIQGAGGMRMYHPVYLKLLREACDRYGVHLIHDERTEYHFYGNLSDLSKKLEDLGFLRVQRSFLVNMEYIVQLQYEKVSLTGGIVLPSSAKNHKELKQHYLLWRGKNRWAIS